jgi:hypothetical protein
VVQLTGHVLASRTTTNSWAIRAWSMEATRSGDAPLRMAAAFVRDRDLTTATPTHQRLAGPSSPLLRRMLCRLCSRRVGPIHDVPLLRVS